MEYLTDSHAYLGTFVKRLLTSINGFSKAHTRTYRAVTPTDCSNPVLKPHLENCNYLRICHFKISRLKVICYPIIIYFLLWAKVGLINFIRLRNVFFKRTWKEVAFRLFLFSTAFSLVKWIVNVLLKIRTFCIHNGDVIEAVMILEKRYNVPVVNAKSPH